MSAVLVGDMERTMGSVGKGLGLLGLVELRQARQLVAVAVGLGVPERTVGLPMGRAILPPQTLAVAVVALMTAVALTGLVALVDLATA
jgi:hypothetical protein